MAARITTTGTATAGAMVEAFTPLEEEDEEVPEFEPAAPAVELELEEGAATVIGMVAVKVEEPDVAVDRDREVMLGLVLAAPMAVVIVEPPERKTEVEPASLAAEAEEPLDDCAADEAAEEPPLLVLEDPPPLLLPPPEEPAAVPLAAVPDGGAFGEGGVLAPVAEGTLKMD